MNRQLLVGAVLDRAAYLRPGAVAASLGGEQITFAELARRGRALGRTLETVGVGAGDRVAWWGATTLDAVVLFSALASSGAVFVPINSRLAPAEAAEVLGRADPSIVVTDGSDPGHGGPTVVLGQLLEQSEAAGGPAGGESGGPAGGPAEGDAEGPAEGDPHVIFFTSGSTGAPKGVVLSHRANVLRSVPSSTTTPRGATVCMFPMFHMASWSIALGCWQAGDEVAFVERPDAEALLAAVEARRARRLYAIPAVWGRILASDLGAFDLSSLLEADTGTSATPPELLTSIRAALPWTITRVLYGSTEAGPATVLGPDDLEAKPGSVGRPSPLVEIRLGDGGEVCLRSPFLMSGYFRDPEATEAALAGGWYHSGDLGAVDDDGYLSIVGRARDVIRTGGESVAPVEVETVVAAHPDVAEVAVVGVPDPAWGEVICAVIVPRPGATVDLGAVQVHCTGRLARFKVPRRVVTVDALPRTAATGQVQRTLLIERLGLNGGAA